MRRCAQRGERTRFDARRRRRLDRARPRRSGAAPCAKRPSATSASTLIGQIDCGRCGRYAARRARSRADSMTAIGVAKTGSAELDVDQDRARRGSMSFCRRRWGRAARRSRRATSSETSCRAPRRPPSSDAYGGESKQRAHVSPPREARRAAISANTGPPISAAATPSLSSVSVGSNAHDDVGATPATRRRRARWAAANAPDRGRRLRARDAAPRCRQSRSRRRPRLRRQCRPRRRGRRASACAMRLAPIAAAASSPSVKRLQAARGGENERGAGGEKCCGERDVFERAAFDRAERPVHEIGERAGIGRKIERKCDQAAGKAREADADQTRGSPGRATAQPSVVHERSPRAARTARTLPARKPRSRTQTRSRRRARRNRRGRARRNPRADCATSLAAQRPRGRARRRRATP